MKNISQVIEESMISIYNNRHDPHPVVVGPRFVKLWNKYFPDHPIVPDNKKNKEKCE